MRAGTTKGVSDAAAEQAFAVPRTAGTAAWSNSGVQGWRAAEAAGQARCAGLPGGTTAKASKASQVMKRAAKAHDRLDRFAPFMRSSLRLAGTTER
ncbi:MAG: hypothetical protein DMH00_06885 [Acidobacteria bacterium]|nr:MAG: hypothetical protein DMH00_06885 [Acidobacteriota bacterium]